MLQDLGGVAQQSGVFCRVHGGVAAWTGGNVMDLHQLESWTEHLGLWNAAFQLDSINSRMSDSKHELSAATCLFHVHMTGNASEVMHPVLSPASMFCFASIAPAYNFSSCAIHIQSMHVLKCSHPCQQRLLLLGL